MADGSERFGYDDASRARDLFAGKMRERGMEPNDVGEVVIAGSGLGYLAKDHMEVDLDAEGNVKDGLPFDDFWEALGIATLPGEKVKGHKCELVVGSLKGEDSKRLVLVQSGREHPYEGISTRRATFWLRLAQLLGVKTLLGSNAAGILTPGELKRCDLMLINGDIDNGKDNPLTGYNDPRFGTRFPDMGDDGYPEATRKLMRSVAARLGINLKEGMYVREPGPNYESRNKVYQLADDAERIWKRGARVWHDERYVDKPVVAGVGMSTTFEALVARHAFLAGDAKNPVFKNRAWVSVMTNFAAMLGADPNGGGSLRLEHGDVAEAAEEVRPYFGRLIKETLLELRAVEDDMDSQDSGA